MMQTRKESPRVLDDAIAILARGGLVITPSRTNFCVVCDPTNRAAINKVFTAKRRTKFGPLTVFTPSISAAGELVDLPPGVDERLLSELWPGEVSLIFKQRFAFPDELTMGARTLALCHQGACTLRRLVDRLAKPLALTSANLSGQGDIHVDEQRASTDLRAAVDLLITHDAVADETAPPATSSRHPSNTIVDMTFTPPRLVRRGALSLAALQAHIPDLDTDADAYAALIADRAATRGSTP
jgi:L-threonylcarbamoyladenylate synthase